MGRLAQLEERLPYKEEVTGSSPVPPTRFNSHIFQQFTMRLLAGAELSREGDNYLESIGNPLDWRTAVREIAFTLRKGRITFDLPDEPPGDHAYVFKISGFETSLTGEASAKKAERIGDTLE